MKTVLRWRVVCNVYVKVDLLGNDELLPNSAMHVIHCLLSFFQIPSRDCS